MGEQADSPLGPTEDRHANRRGSTDDWNENTRRTFLGGAIGSALAGAVGIGTVGTATGQVTASQFAVACDYIEVTDASGIDSIRVDFRDGSFVSSENGITLDGGEPMRLGSPGRTVTAVTVNGDRTFDSFDPCQPQRRRRTTFTASAVHLPAGEFVINGWVPGSLTSAVTLHFADGTTEIAQGYSTDGDGPMGSFPDFDVFAVEGATEVTNHYRGTGANAGKVIEAIRIETDVDYRRFHLVSDVADAAHLGTRSSQERPIEIVGASQGAVEYELTATGPIRPLQINDRIGAGDNDSITQNDDGTWTVTGFTGNTGYGDAYVVSGEITDFVQTAGDGDYVVRELERRVLDVSGSVGDGQSDSDTSHELAVIATEAGEVSYEFTVEGTVERASGVEDRLRAEDDDEISDTGDGTVTVSGFTGNTGYGDTYVVDGEIRSFERTGGQAAYRLAIDGETVDPAQLDDSTSSTATTNYMF